MKEFSGIRNIQTVCKDYQGVIHNTYHGGHIETYHHVICSILEDVAKQSVTPNFTTPIPGILREVLDNEMAPRDKISLNGLGIKNVNLEVYL